MSDDQCQATTQDGSRCQNSAGDDGYCHVSSHGPEDEQSNDRDTQARDPQYDPELVAQAIRQADGNLSEAARDLGVHRCTVHRYCEDFEVCEQARDDSRMRLVDKSRSTLDRKMESKDERIALDAAKFAAKHYDPAAKRRQDVTSDDEQVDGGIGIYLPDNGSRKDGDSSDTD